MLISASDEMTIAAMEKPRPVPVRLACFTPEMPPNSPTITATPATIQRSKTKVGMVTSALTKATIARVFGAFWAGIVIRQQ